MLRVIKAPWEPFEKGFKRPLVINGAAGAVGAYAVKLAMLMNIHPIICVAGNEISFVKTLIGEDDVIVDYRKGHEAMVQETQDALQGSKLEYAFDAVSEKGSFINLRHVLEKGGRLSLVLPGLHPDIPAHLELSTTMAGSLWKVMAKDLSRNNRAKLDIGEGGRDFGLVFSRLIGKWMREEKLANHPNEVVEGGLLGVETALTNLRQGKNTATKLVVSHSRYTWARRKDSMMVQVSLRVEVELNRRGSLQDSGRAVLCPDILIEQVVTMERGS